LWIQENRYHYRSEEKKKGLDKIMEHYGRSAVNVYDEKHVADIVVLRLIIDTLTGKQSGNWFSGNSFENTDMLVE
jgi:hypothetical protein